ncbi:MAG: TolC family protein, partial [Ferruginibacter sp.]
MKLKFPVITALLLFFFTALNAQKKWNLKNVVEYAMENNLVVKQAQIQSSLSELNYSQAKKSLIPNLNFSTATSLNSGSNQDPTSFGRITQTYVATNVQLQSSAEIFNFYSKRNSILATEWDLRASKAGVDKAKNDIALTAANTFLQILLALEQQKIAAVQIKQTTDQLSNTRKMVDAGTLPELNAAQLEAQLALDSVNYISAKGNVVQATLQLKSYMNIDAAEEFEVEAPLIENIPLEPIADLQPDFVYKTALANQPLQKINEYKLKAAQKNALSVKGSMYPTLSAFGSLGSGYNNQAMEVSGITQFIAPVGSVQVGGVSYEVFPNQPFTNYSYSKTGFTSQLTDNFRQSIGLNLNIPILNGGSLKTAYLKSKLMIKTVELDKLNDDQNLKQDIYAAYNSALISLEKYNASKKNQDINEKTLMFATKRFDVGMLSTFDLITTQNNLLRAKLENSINLFDYVFKMKVLEFYKGQ